MTVIDEVENLPGLWIYAHVIVAEKGCGDVSSSVRTILRILGFLL